MKTYVIEKDAEFPLIILSFPRDSKWDGTAKDISSELHDLLNQATESQFVMVDISESDPTILNVSVAANYHMHSKWMTHRNLGGIFVISTDPAVRAMLNVMKNQFPALNIDLFRNRADAIATIK